MLSVLCCAVPCCDMLCCAAPQYGSAKSVANIAGMVAANVLRGDHPVVHWDTVDWDALRLDPKAVIVDVREVSVAHAGVDGIRCTGRG